MHDQEELRRLTDRDGVRGAVKFAKAGLVHGVAPILGAEIKIGTPAERAKGQAWGLKTIESFHTHGTPPVEKHGHG